MSLEMARSGSVAVARLSGDIDMAGTASITAAIAGGIPGDATALVVDLSDVRYLDSAGVQMLFDIGRMLDIARRGFGVVVAEDAPVRAVVKLAHVGELAALCSSLDECIDALADGGGRRD